MKDGLKIIEQSCAIIQHMIALREVVRFMEEKNYEAAMARLEGSLAALEAMTKGTVVGLKLTCDRCGDASEVSDWAVDGVCPKCGRPSEDESQDEPA